MKVYLDGVLQKQDAAMGVWESTSTLTIPGGTKVLAIECADHGVIEGILASTSGGLVTDSSWQCSRTEVAGWTAVDFVDSSGSFAPADQSRGTHGVDPWGVR
jgi:hypothetical protein